MTKNPIFNALSASAYIVIIVSVMTFLSRYSTNPDKFFAPVLFISMFTLSAAIMGYIFCGQPILLYLDGQKKQAVKLFLQTVLAFGSITLVVLVLLISGVLK